MRLMLTVAMLLMVIVGCAARTPIEELQAEAEITGDWSAVQQHQRMDRRMNRVQGEEACNNGYVLACFTKGEREECGCVSPIDRGLRQ